MSKLYNAGNREFVYDFRKPRVRETIKSLEYNSKHTSVMDKFSMGSLIGHNGDYWYGASVTIYNLYHYDEVKQRMLEFLEEKKFDNVTIIK